MFPVRRALPTAVCVVAIGLLLPGCRSLEQPAPEQYRVEGVAYGVTRGNFRGRWWNYYERGRSFADGDFLAEAERDLRRALAMRDRDARYAPTYGMHFIAYFGNRELGVTLFRREQYREAIRHLQRSLDQEPTEKAEYYLSAAQQALAEAEADRTLPTLQLAALPPLLADTALVVRGQARDDRHVARLLVNGVELPVPVAKPMLAFAHTVALAPGPQRIEVVAVDTSGNRVVIGHDVVVDLQAPLLARLPGAPLAELHLHVQDALACTVAAQQNLELLRQDLGAGVWVFRYVDAAAPAQVCVADAAGNRNALDLQPAVAPAQPAPPVRQQAAGRADDPATPAPATPDPAPAVPVISLDYLQPDMVVYQPAVVVAGAVAGTFRKLTVDGDVLAGAGADMRFAVQRPLAIGENTVVVSVEGADGTVVERRVRLDRHQPPTKLMALRAVAMLTPLSREGRSAELRPRDYSRLLLALHQAHRFRMLDRENLEAVAAEQQLVVDGWVDAATAARVGRLAAADYTIACSIRPTRDDIEIFARLIDTETARVLASCDVYEPGVTATNIANVYDRFARKLATIFPVVEEPVNDASPRAVALGVGANAGLRKGMRFTSYSRRGGFTDPATGQVIVRGKVVVGDDLVVRRVSAQRAVLKPADGEQLANHQFAVAK
jgi:tetratricopeptide (TPR) repeat protein/TolB-like protein